MKGQFWNIDENSDFEYQQIKQTREYKMNDIKTENKTSETKVSKYEIIAIK